MLATMETQMIFHVSSENILTPHITKKKSLVRLALHFRYDALEFEHPRLTSHHLVRHCTKDESQHDREREVRQDRHPNDLPGADHPSPGHHKKSATGPLHNSNRLGPLLADSDRYYYRERQEAVPERL